MSLVQLNIMYGHLEGIEGKFARDPSGYLSIEAGIYQKHGLDSIVESCSGNGGALSQA